VYADLLGEDEEDETALVRKNGHKSTQPAKPAQVSREIDLRKGQRMMHHWLGESAQHACFVQGSEQGNPRCDALLIGREIYAIGRARDCQVSGLVHSEVLRV
jgi:hypothetical protein